MLEETEERATELAMARAAHAAQAAVEHAVKQAHEACRVEHERAIAKLEAAAADRLERARREWAESKRRADAEREAERQASSNAHKSDHFYPNLSKPYCISRIFAAMAKACFARFHAVPRQGGSIRFRRARTCIPVSPAMQSMIATPCHFCGPTFVDPLLWTHFVFPTLCSPLFRTKHRRGSSSRGERWRSSGRARLAM